MLCPVILKYIRKNLIGFQKEMFTMELFFNEGIGKLWRNTLKLINRVLHFIQCENFIDFNFIYVSRKLWRNRLKLFKGVLLIYLN